MVAGTMSEWLKVTISIAAAIGTIGGAAAIIYKVIEPAIILKDEVEDLQRATRKDFQRLEGIELLQEELGLAVIALLRNAETDNSTGGLCRARERLENVLIVRSLK